MIKLNISLAKQPFLHDFTKVKEHYGLVGEEKSFLLGVLATMNKQYWGVESLSGTGKTVILDVIFRIIPDDYVYTMKTGSKTSQYYQADKINTAKIIYIPELQKADYMLEALKDLTEGKDFSRDVRDQIGDRNIVQKIKKGVGVVYSLALENDLKKDTELSRRVFQVTTDISEEQNKRVIEYKAMKRFKKERLDKVALKDEEEYRKHVRECMDLEVKSFENPFAEYLIQNVPAPYNIVRSHTDHYFNLMEASARFHFKNRLLKEGKLFLTLQDAWIIHVLYGAQFYRSIQHIPFLGERVLRVFEDTVIKRKKNKEKLGEYIEEETLLDRGHSPLTVAEIHNELKKKNVVMKHVVIHNICEELVEAGYLESEKSGGKNMYIKAADVVEFEEGINWKECLEFGLNNMQKNYPEHYDEWLKTNALVFKNPLSGELFDINKQVVKTVEKQKPLFVPKNGTLVVEEEVVE